MNSLQYVKQRISEGATNLSDCNYKSMEEINVVDIFETMYKSRVLENGLIIKTDNNKIAEIFYNPDIEFNYFTMSRNVNDGTLLFDLEAMQDALFEVLSCHTYNKAVLLEAPDNQEFFDTHYLKYTIGNIVLCQEYDDNKFTVAGKPWLKRRTTALLPIKFEVMVKTCDNKHLSFH